MAARAGLDDFDQRPHALVVGLGDRVGDPAQQARKGDAFAGGNGERVCCGRERQFR